MGYNIETDRSNFHNERRDNLNDVACEWILQHPKFLAWRNESASSQLILFGALGTGKTIVTVYVVEEINRVSKYIVPRFFVCFHYCHTGERGTARYIYSSLIWQLLEQHGCLKVKFDKWYTKLKESGRTSPTESQADLGDFLLSCVESLDRELYILIDGLDECDRETQYELTKLLNNLTLKALKVKVFLTSRFQTKSLDDLRNSRAIIWKPTESRDAEIVEHVVNRRLRESKPIFKSLVKTKLSERAEGSAIWIALTVQLIQKQRISALGPLKSFLNNIPAPVELERLYQRLFAYQTGEDEENVAVASRALETLAVVRRPLNMRELGWVIALQDPRTANVHTVTELEDYVDSKRILDILQPFLLHVDFKDERKRQVELVHKSLQGIILEQPPSEWVLPYQRQVKPNNRDSSKRVHEIETSLLRACVKYLLMEDFDEINLLSEDQAMVQALDEMPQSGLFDDIDPNTVALESIRKDTDKEDEHYDPARRGFGEFFVYASCYWLEHYRTSNQELAPKIKDIIQLCRAGSKRLNNWVGQKCRPDCTILSQNSYDIYLLDSLQILALEGPLLAFQEIVEDLSIDINGADFRHNTLRETIYNILRLGDISRLPILFHAPKFTPVIRNIGIFHQMMKAWSQSDKNFERWSGCFDLIYDICDDVLTEDLWANELLCLAVGSGCLPIVERLFDAATRKPDMKSVMLQNLRREVQPNLPVAYHQSVGEAVWNNHVDVLKYLLKQDGIDTHLKHRDLKGNNVLHKAHRYCNPEVIELLLSCFPEGANHKNEDDDTPLDIILFNPSNSDKQLKSVRLLLQYRNASAKGDEDRQCTWKEPIRVAARNGNVQMCHLLVEIGDANPRNALKFENGQPSLRDPMHFTERASDVLETLCSLAGIVV